MAAVQGFVVVFQMSLLALALAAKLGFQAPGSVHEATPAPPPSHTATHAVL